MAIKFAPEVANFIENLPENWKDFYLDHMLLKQKNPVNDTRVGFFLSVFGVQADKKNFNFIDSICDMPDTKLAKEVITQLCVNNVNLIAVFMESAQKAVIHSQEISKKSKLGFVEALRQSADILEKQINAQSEEIQIL